MRVLLVEGGLATSSGLSQICQQARIGSDRLGVGQDPICPAAHFNYDMILLAVMMPETDGVGIIRRMRRAGINTPVLVLADRSRAAVKLHAFRAGADDCMIQPFDTEELIARIHAIVRRSRAPGRAVLTCGSLNMDFDAKEVSIGSTKVALTARVRRARTAGAAERHDAEQGDDCFTALQDALSSTLVIFGPTARLATSSPNPR